MLYDLWVRLDSIRQKVRTAFIVSELELVVVKLLLSGFCFCRFINLDLQNTNRKAADGNPGITGKLGRQWTIWIKEIK